ncbi:MAG TPA: lasso peptide biosynthesis B2 protein [Allosphingosinicella sp.]|nr:lasso peptide biosynthesis B2 protein [Allosphingosinicella sp.]
MQLRLAPHVSFGLVGERPVFLDLARDRYLILDGEAAAAFDRLRGPDPGLTEAQASRLVATGLFEQGPSPGPIAPLAAPAATAQLELEGTGRAGIGDRLAAWRLLRRVHSELRSTPLLTLLLRRACLPSRPGAAEAGGAPALARRFLRGRASAPQKPRCLPDSLALWDWLQKRGIASSIIFGVKLDPFGAHCWVQHGALALNEALDRVAEYDAVGIFP